MPLSVDELPVLIGRITMNFQALEQVVSMAVWKAIGDEEIVGEILTAEMSFRNRVNAFQSLSIYRIEEETHSDKGRLAELNVIVKEAGSIEETRNRYIHSLWTIAEPDGGLERIKVTAKKRHTVQQEQVTEEQFSELSARIRRLIHRIGAFSDLTLQTT